GRKYSVNSAPRLYLPLPVPVLLPLLWFSPTRCPPVQNTVPITVSGWRRYG
ncbi:core domain protein, partial [Escherichia coli EC1735]